MGEDHILNVDLCVKLVITFISTDTENMRTWLFHKRNGVWNWLHSQRNVGSVHFSLYM